jgi:hypothetical protein
MLKAIIMQSSLTLTAILILVVLAGFAHVSSAGVYAPTSDLNALAKLTPMSALPFPKDLELKYVLLRISTQNYNCI